jgi:hypothetical protein
VQSGGKKVSQVHRMVVGFRETGVVLITLYPKTDLDHEPEQNFRSKTVAYMNSLPERVFFKV